MCLLLISILLSVKLKECKRVIMKKPKNDLEMEPRWDNPQYAMLYTFWCSQQTWSLGAFLIVFVWVFCFLGVFLPFLSVNAEKLKDILSLNFETKLLYIIPLEYLPKMKLMGACSMEELVRNSLSWLPVVHTRHHDAIQIQKVEGPRYEYGAKNQFYKGNWAS